MKLQENNKLGDTPKISVMYCVNSLPQGISLPAELDIIKLPCSSMVKDVFLLRAFEAGADGVVVLGCPPGECQRIDGNIRAEKRVKWTKALLDEVGVGGERLVYGPNTEAIQTIAAMGQTLARIGRTPLKKITAK
jgi:F420-non-reducing hydrogenase iron-sulfur subunit